MAGVSRKDSSMRLSEGGGKLGLKLVVGPARLENRVESVVRSEQFVGPERLRFSAGMVSGQMRGLGGAKLSVVSVNGNRAMR